MIEKAYLINEIEKTYIESLRDNKEIEYIVKQLKRYDLNTVKQIAKSLDIVLKSPKLNY